jgi:hypothetical protein
VHQKKDEPEPLVMGEKTLGQLVSRNNYVSADNLDFSEFDESGDLKDKTVRDKVSKKIAERFNQGGLDEVGWERISTGISGLDSETSKLNIDEHTTPGDIVFTTKRLLEEVRNIPGVGSNEHYGTANQYRIQMTTYEHKIMREEEFSQDEINTLIGIYSKSYRLNRAVLHRECVVLDPEKTGYWSSFAPYFM